MDSAQEGAGSRVGTCRHDDRENLTNTDKAMLERVAARIQQVARSSRRQRTGNMYRRRQQARQNQPPQHTEYLQQDRRTEILPCAALVGLVRTSTDPTGL